MDQPPPPPRPPAPAPNRRPVVSRGLAATIALATAFVGAGTTYIVMEQRTRELGQELDEVRAQANRQGDASEESGENGAPLDDLGSLEDLLGGDLGDGLGADLGGDLMQCLTPQPSGGDGIPEGELSAQVSAIEELIVADREFTRDSYDIEFVTMDEVQRRAVDITSQELDHEAASVDARVLAALGAIDPTVDLAEAQLEALDAGVAGFYDPDTRKLVIGSETMDGIGTLIASHELVHAMADSTFGLPDTQRIAEASGSDAALAALSAVEGDASLYSQRFIAEHLAFDDLLGLGLQSLESQDMAGMPHFVQRDLEFPYIEGLAFTCDVFLNGGWAGVDAMYDDIPATSAQVLFPDRYHAGEPAVQVRTPSDPDGWELIESDEFGAADLLFLFEAPGDDTAQALGDPLERVSAWAGGSVHAWDLDGDTAVALTLADRGGTTPLCESVNEYYAAAFPEAATKSAEGETTFDGSTQSAAIRCDADEVALGIGPDLTAARAAIV